MSRLTKKNNQGIGSWTQFGDEYIPAHNVKHKHCVNKLGKLEDLMEKYEIEDLIDLEIALVYYYHRFDGVHTERVGN